MKNIVILSLTDCLNIVKVLSEDYDFMYVDTDKLIDYELIDVEKVLNTTGKEYFDKQVKKIVNGLVEFEDCFSFIKSDIAILTRDILKDADCVKIFIDVKTLPKTGDAIKDSKLVANDRKELLKSFSNYVLEFETYDEEQIKSAIKKVVNEQK